MSRFAARWPKGISTASFARTTAAMLLLGLLGTSLVVQSSARRLLAPMAVSWHTKGAAGMCVEVQDGEVTYNGAQLVPGTCNGSPMQQFYTKDQGDGSVEVRSDSNGVTMCWTISSDTTRMLMQWKCVGTPDQKFMLATKDRMLNVKPKTLSGQCLTVMTDAQKGSWIQVMPCSGALNQAFTV